MGMVKKDNSTLRQKAALRRNLLREIEWPVILETHGGWGVIYERCYSAVERGVVFEKDEDKVAALARQRPGWGVYEADCVRSIAAGAVDDWGINFVDVDPYGEPWPVLEALFRREMRWPSRLALAVNDGLRQKLRIGAWDVGSMQEVVARYGNKVADQYVEICREKVEEIVEQAGYGLLHWTGYYCGTNDNMTHYGAVLKREGR